MDIYWTVAAGQDPLKYFSKFPGRFDQWHVKDMDKAVDRIVIAIENHENTDYIVLVKDRGYARIPGAENETDKPYLFFRDYNEGGLREFPIELKEGRLPERKNEVAVSGKETLFTRMKTALWKH